MVDKVVATDATLELIALLKRQYGNALFFHQSGGRCDNSAANCYLPGELTIGAGDVYLGDTGGTFSLEGPEGKVFRSRPRVFADAEWAELCAAEPGPSD